MPQLNPAPWFMTFIGLWAVLLFTLKPRLLRLIPLQPPALHQYVQLFYHWNWPWL